MNTIELQVKTRKSKGNSPARALRRGGQMPAVLYGPKTPPSMIALQTRDLELILNKGGLGRSVISLFVDGGQAAKPVMIKELQIDPVTKDLLHVDFYEVSMDRKIRVKIPVVVTGRPVGVENGGVLQMVRRDVEVFCLPNEIPNAITVDVTNLDIGQAFHVEDIKIEGNIEIPHEVNFTILTISAAKREAEVVAEGEEGEAGDAAAAAETEKAEEE
ncbi:MAG: 50S ribosomal protein L25 [Desulfobacteraceae bacterium]|nr:50S ribosomal protein L25 [Desulfobacteraceae bacterium]